MLKLTVGAVIAVMVGHMLGLEPVVRASRPQPEWEEWAALAVTACAFAWSFRTSRRDFPWVVAAAMCSYAIARFAGDTWGSPVGVFLSALTFTACGNAFGRWAKRPGATIRLPGIIMLVPGSTSLRGVLTLVQQQNVDAGQAALLTVMNVVLALIAGLLFGNLLIPARKHI